MSRPLVVSSDLSRLNMERPAGAAVYASFVLELLRATADVELVNGREAGRADMILSLDGRFRAGRGQRTVTAVHDLGYLFERAGYGRREWIAQNWRVASAVRRSDHLLAPSEALRFGLERYLRAPARKISVMPPIPRTCFQRPPRDEVAAVGRELELPSRYFVFVGSRAKRKNLGLLAAAWAAAAPRLGPEVGLVLAGPGSGGPPAARDLGYVPLSRLPGLIAGAIAWVNSSFYEGCAVGAQEAMACGTPPLAAGTGAQARAIGNAGLILDPHDPGQWAQALVAIAVNPDLRARLSVSCLKAAAELRTRVQGIGPWTGSSGTATRGGGRSGNVTGR